MYWKATQNALLTHLKCDWLWIWLFWGKFEKVKLIPGTSGRFLRDVQGTHGRHFGETQWTHQPSTFSAFLTLLQPATRTCCTLPDVFTISYRLWSYKLKLWCLDDIHVSICNSSSLWCPILQANYEEFILHIDKLHACCCISEPDGLRWNCFASISISLGA